jgi:hypothetical protein
MGESRLGEVERAPEIGVHYLLGAVERHVFHGSAAAATGAVHDHVETSGFSYYAINGVLKGCGVADIGGKGFHAGEIDGAATHSEYLITAAGH